MTYTDKAFHFSMCFTATVLLMRLGLTRRGAACIVAACAVLLEVYQWLFEPHYAGKGLDTAVDMIANVIGITLAARGR